MNLFPAYGQGNFEATAFSSQNFNLNQGGSNVVVYTFSRIFVAPSIDGSCGRFTINFINSTPTFLWKLRSFEVGAPAPMYGLVTGRKYRIKAFIRTPSGNPLASSSTIISLSPELNTPVGGLGSNQPLEQLVTKTISACTDSWQEVSCVITEQALRQGINLFVHTAVSPLAPTYGVISKTGSLITLGQLFIDNITVEEIATTCTTVLGSPSYTSIRESGTGLNNGSIVVNGTSQFSLSYSINGGVTYQLSNIFTGLAPGVYDIKVREDNPFVPGCIIDIDDITVLPYISEIPPLVPTDTTKLILTDSVNAFNYLRWKVSRGNLTFTNIEDCSPELATLPNRYAQIDHSAFALPVVCNSEQFSFFINFTSPYTNGVKSRMRLGIVNKHGIVQTNIAPLSFFDVENSLEYYIYCSLTLFNVPKGNYRLIVYDITTTDVFFTSSEFTIMDLVEAQSSTIKLRFRSSLDIYNYKYEESPMTSFYGLIRLKANKIDDQFEGELTQYRAASSGRLRNVSYELDYFVTIETFYFSDELHKFMGVLQVHDFLQINGVMYLPKGLYKKETNKELNANIGKWELYSQAFSSSNRYARTIPGQEINPDEELLAGDEGQLIKI